MDTINNDLTNLLQQMGVHKESLGITQRIVIIAGILIIAFVADYFCRKIVVPTIKKLTARTQATWDDYLFNDAVLDNMCHLIPPIILYVFIKNKNMEIKVLGTGCAKCKTTYQTIEKVISENNLEDVKLTKVEDIVEILNSGIMATPAVVVDGAVKVKGHVPSEKEVKQILGI